MHRGLNPVSAHMYGMFMKISSSLQSPISFTNDSIRCWSKHQNYNGLYNSHCSLCINCFRSNYSFSTHYSRKYYITAELNLHSMTVFAGERDRELLANLVLES